MESVLDDPGCVEALLSHLPEDCHTLSERCTMVCRLKLFEFIISCAVNSYDLPCLCGYDLTASIQLHTLQWRQSIGSLVSALRCENSDAATANFGLDPAAGAAKFAFGDGTLTSLC